MFLERRKCPQHPLVWFGVSASLSGRNIPKLPSASQVSLKQVLKDTGPSQSDLPVLPAGLMHDCRSGVLLI